MRCSWESVRDLTARAWPSSSGRSHANGILSPMKVRRRQPPKKKRLLSDDCHRPRTLRVMATGGDNSIFHVSTRPACSLLTAETRLAQLVPSRAIFADESEVARNPRARSAVMRVAERLES